MKIASLVSAVISSIAPLAFAEDAGKIGHGVPVVDYHYGMHLDVASVLQVGQEIEARITNIDRKNRNISLSIKAKDQADEADAMQKFNSDNAGAAGTTNLGALLKAKLDSKNNE